MVDAPDSIAAEITGTVPFFKNPEPLSVERHGALGVQKSEADYRFVREVHVVPVTVGEFGPAALNYPIIFAGETKTPLVVMGLRSGENLFVDEQGRVDADAYVPAFVRRYPFVFAEDKDNSRFVVCIDTESDFIVEGGEVALFENGQPTQFTNDAIEFLKTFEQQRQTTMQLVKLLEDHELFEEKDVTFQPRNPDGTEGDRVKVAEYYAASMEKLGALPAETLVQFRDSGALAAIYVHNISLLNWQRVLSRALRRNAPQSA